MESVKIKVKRCLRWVRRFRKRCGYGIHSPFAFQLVTGVIYEDGEYYVYDKLSHLDKTDCSLRSKDLRLLFRLVNNQSPLNGCTVGHVCPVTLRYLQAGRKHCDWYNYTSFDFIPSAPVNHPSIDFLYCETDQFKLSHLNSLVDCASDRALFVFHGIHSSPAHLHFWKTLISHPKIRVSFDLYDFGLVYFEARLNKENYIINYF